MISELGKKTIHFWVFGTLSKLDAACVVFLEIMLTPFVKTQWGDLEFFFWKTTALIDFCFSKGSPKDILY